MTCAQMSGPCDEKIKGNTEEEMITNGMKHLEEAHPDMAANVKAMPQTDPMMVGWMEKFKKDFADAPQE